MYECRSAGAERSGLFYSSVFLRGEGQRLSLIHIYLANNIGDPKNTVLFVGYCAEHTLGRKIMDGWKAVSYTHLDVYRRQP